MIKKAIFVGVLSVYSLCTLSPFAVSAAGADSSENYYGGVYANSTITGTHSLYPNSTTQVAGVCGVYSPVRSEIGHSVQPVGGVGSTSITYVTEQLNTDYSYFIRNNVGLWKSIQIDSYSYVDLPAVVDYLGGSFGVYEYSFTVDSPSSGAVARVDVILNILDVKSGYFEQYAYTNSIDFLNGSALLQLELDLSGIQWRNPSTYLITCTTLLSCSLSDDTLLDFDWEIQGLRAVPVRAGYAYDYYLPESVQLSSLLSPIFSTVSNFFKIEILPGFHLYDILMFGVATVVIGFVMKLFLGG